MILLGVVAALAGCAKDEVSDADMAKNRNEFSQENYDKAMKEAGKTAELEKEKAAAAERGEQ